MRILHYSVHMGGFMYEWPHYHMIAELRTAGHTVVYCNPVEILGHVGSVGKYSEVLLRQVRSMMNDGGCDMVFASATDNHIEPSAILEIRRMGAPCVNFHCDDLTVPYRLRKIAGSFDLQWITSREAEPLISSYGANVIAMPMAANPYFFRRKSVAEERVIGFIGSPYGARARHIVALVTSEIPVCIYGKTAQAVGVGGHWKSNPATRGLSKPEANVLSPESREASWSLWKTRIA